MELDRFWNIMVEQGLALGRGSALATSFDPIMKKLRHWKKLQDEKDRKAAEEANAKKPETPPPPPAPSMRAPPSRVREPST